MMAYITTFTNNLLPILLLGGAGFALGRILSIDSRSFGRVIFNILSPALIFNLITKNQLPLDKIGVMAGYSVLVFLLVGGIAYLVARLFRFERSVLTAVILTSLLANNGNFGLPLIAFAFGEKALAYATIYFVVSAIIIYTLGVFIASLGHLEMKTALLGLLKVPAIYAILIAMVFIRMGWTMPGPLQRAIGLASDGAIPAMLVLLGLELTHFQWNRNIAAMGLPVIIRLVISPLVGLGAANALGLNGISRQVGVTQSGMPSAVLATVLAEEYKLDSSLITAIVFITTLLSPFTLTPLIVFFNK